MLIFLLFLFIDFKLFFMCFYVKEKNYYDFFINICYIYRWIFIGLKFGFNV